jgi:hypothetical protein
MREIWRSIKGFEGLYEVGKSGKVRRANKEKLLSQRKNNRGYFLVDLYKNNKRYQCLVHRLVAQTFINNPNKYPCVNHKDENKENNNADNLEWCTQKYNMNYGSCPKRIGKANSKSVIQYDNSGNVVGKYASILCAERMTGISNGSIGDCLHGRRKTAGGFKWCYEK